MADLMYRRIAEDIRKQIESGALPPGSQLPTELELRERYMASRNTIREAFKFLAMLGLVLTRPGQGTFVTEEIEPFIIRLGTRLAEDLVGDTAFYPSEMSSSRAIEVTTPMVEVSLATGVVREELQLPEGTQVVSRHHRRFIDSVAWSLQTSFYPMALVQGGAALLLSPEDIVEGTARYLVETLGIRQAGWNERLAVRPPDADEANFFRIFGGGVALVEIVRTVYDQVGAPICVTMTSYPADRNRFIMTVGAVPEPTRQVTKPPDPAANPMHDDRAAAVVALER